MRLMPLRYRGPENGLSLAGGGADIALETLKG